MPLDGGGTRIANSDEMGVISDALTLPYKLDASWGGSDGARVLELVLGYFPDGRFRLHSETRPAMVCADGSRFWARSGRWHRDGDLPALEFATGFRKWLVNGLLHREGDQPATIQSDGVSVWWRRGQLHREGGKPAVTYPEPHHAVWYVNDRKHRDDGPAHQIAGGFLDLEWALDGQSFDVDMARLYRELSKGGRLLEDGGQVVSLHGEPAAKFHVAGAGWCQWIRDNADRYVPELAAAMRAHTMQHALARIEEGAAVAPARRTPRVSHQI